MFKTASRKTWVRSAVAAAALAAAGTASAAQWVGTWDPVYLSQWQIGSSPFLTPAGSPFFGSVAGDNTYLYFKGSATINTGTCGGTGTFYSVATSSNPVSSCASGWSVTNITMTIGSVYATDFDNNPGTFTTPTTFVSNPNYGKILPTATPIASYTWTAASLLGTQITSMKFSGGNLVGLSADYSTPGHQEVYTASYGDPNPISAVGKDLLGNWILPFMSVAFTYNEGSGPETPTALFGWTRYIQNSYSCTSDKNALGSLECGAAPADIEFTQAIPEPSTYALMGLGLAAVAVMRRRATRQRKQA